jgi:hypothetical protein
VLIKQSSRSAGLSQLPLPLQQKRLLPQPLTLLLVLDVLVMLRHRELKQPAAPPLLKAPAVLRASWPMPSCCWHRHCQDPGESQAQHCGGAPAL